MEPRFGLDFNKVRVHTDSTSVQMNQELGAQAFTHGHDVYFGAGKYHPGAIADLESLFWRADKRLIINLYDSQ